MIYEFAMDTSTGRPMTSSFVRVQPMVESPGYSNTVTPRRFSSKMN
ncbi:MAG: hypothetical protein M1541_21705 [Acidobacteria bacterium]|nr:hypothetical protein [Acidobacteriota bacterium]